MAGKNLDAAMFNDAVARLGSFRDTSAEVPSINTQPQSQESQQVRPASVRAARTRTAAADSSGSFHEPAPRMADPAAERVRNRLTYFDSALRVLKDNAATDPSVSQTLDPNQMTPENVPASITDYKVALRLLHRVNMTWNHIECRAAVIFPPGSNPLAGYVHAFTHTEWNTLASEANQVKDLDIDE